MKTPKTLSLSIQSQLGRWRWTTWVKRSLAFAGSLLCLMMAVKPVESREVPLTNKNTLHANFDSANAVHAADLDGDGDNDILGAAFVADDIAWWENTAGDGSSWILHTLKADFDGAGEVWAADLDGDSDLDVLGSASEANDITWWENTVGDGSVWSEHAVVTNFDDVHAIYPADLDRDGDLDIIGASYSPSAVKWWENTAGNGSAWDDHLVDGTFDGPTSVYAADLDGDGDLDILGAARFEGHEFAWWENTTGQGSGWSKHSVAGIGGATSVRAADVDGDGDLDIIGAAAFADDIAWWSNLNGLGTSWGLRTVDPEFDGAEWVEVADMDADGDLDLLGAAFWDDDITWWENTDTHGISWTSHNVDGGFSGAKSVYPSDLDGDGDPDIIGAAKVGDEIAWWENTTIHRSAVFPFEHPVDSNFYAASDVTTADMDRDGFMDILGAASDGYDITWWENTLGSGVAWNEHTVDGNFAGARSVAVGDIDGDGDPDVLGAAYTADDIAWWENTNGYTTAWTEHLVESDFNGAISVSAADMDGDGDLDILAAAYSDHVIAWWENTAGDGTAWTQHFVEDVSLYAYGAASVQAADLDRDGDLDVLAAMAVGDDITWWENTAGDGTAWTRRPVEGFFEGARSVHAADVNSDGALDILAAAVSADDIAWWENVNGDGSFWAKRTVDSFFDGALSVYGTDMDGDGDMDILGAAWTADDITWWENLNGAGTDWTEHTVDGIFGNAQAVHAADVDGDGDMDVLGAAWDDNDIAWWENRGGQYALDTINTAPASIPFGEMDDLLRIRMDHRGRIGDTDEEFAALGLLLESSPGNPLTSAEANAIINALHVYLDDGDRTFEPHADTLVTTVETLSLSAGYQQVLFSDGDPNVQVVHTSPRTYFAVVEPACYPNGSQFRITHGITGGSSAEDRDHDILLTLEYVADTSSGIITIPGCSLQYLPLVAR